MAGTADNDLIREVSFILSVLYRKVPLYFIFLHRWEVVICRLWNETTAVLLKSPNYSFKIIHRMDVSYQASVATFCICLRNPRPIAVAYKLRGGLPNKRFQQTSC